MPNASQNLQAVPRNPAEGESDPKVPSRNQPLRRMSAEELLAGLFAQYAQQATPIDSPALQSAIELAVALHEVQNALDLDALEQSPETKQLLGQYPILGRAFWATRKRLADAAPGLVDRRSIARMLGISESKVYYLASAGLIPVRRIGHDLRFDPHEVLEWSKSPDAQKAFRAAPTAATRSKPKAGGTR